MAAIETNMEAYRRDVTIPVRADCIHYHGAPKDKRFEYRMAMSTLRRIYLNGIATHGLDNYINNCVNELCIKLIFKNISTIYALIYIHNYEHGFKVSSSYVTMGGTYMSADGEYRKKFVLYMYYEIIYTKYNDVFNIIEEELVHKMESNEAIFNIISCPVTGLTRDQEQSMYNLVEHNRLPIVLFVLTWFHDAYYLYNDIMTNHINPSFKLIMMDMITRKVYDQIIEKISVEQYRNIVFELTTLADRTKNMHKIVPPVVVGHKRMPMTIADLRAVRAGFGTTRIGRECLIGERCAELTLNMISPSFPLVYGGFCTENTSASVYDNPAMHRYYEVNNLCDELKKQLIQLRKMIRYGDNSELKTNTLVQLDGLLLKCVQSIDLSVVTTDVSFHWLQEHVGYTFKDIPVVITSKSNLEHLNFADIFENYETFAKIMFDYMYAAYCMHSRVGIIHADLHLNNFTVHNPIAFPKDAERRRTERYKMSYMLCEVSKSESYLFNSSDFVGCIIDFSRAYPFDLKTISVGADTDNQPEFLKNRRLASHVVNRFVSIFKSVAGGEGPMLAKLTSPDYREVMFKILSIIDCFTVLENVLLLIKTDESISRGSIKCHPNITKLLADGIAACHNWFENHRAALVSMITAGAPPATADWPSLYVIDKMFAPWNIKNINLESRVSADNVTNTRGVQIDEMYNYNNNITFTRKNPPPYIDPKKYYPIKPVMLPDIKPITVTKSVLEKVFNRLMLVIEDQAKLFGH